MYCSLCWQGSRNMRKKKKSCAFKKMLSFSAKCYSDSGCLPSHSGALDVNDLLPLALCCCDTRTINKLWSPPGYLKVLCACSHTHALTHHRETKALLL